MREWHAGGFLNNRKHMSSKLSSILFFCILALLLFLRFVNTPLRYGIGQDGSRDALVSFESARQLQLPLTGSFSSIGPIPFGPWYYYYITLANFIIPTFWAPWIAIGLASTFQALCMYMIGKRLISTNFGLLLFFISTLSPAQTSAAASLQQHALVGCAATFSFLFLLLLNKNYSYLYSLLFGLSIGLAISFHYQALSLLTLPFLFFLFSRQTRFILPFLTGIGIVLLPSLLFEVNNHWFTSRNIIDYIQFGQYRVWTSNRWLTFATTFLPQFWSFVIGMPTLICSLFMIVAVIILPKYIVNLKTRLFCSILTISFLILIVMLRYYRGEKFFGYLQFFHPYIFLIIGLVIYYFIERLHNLTLTILVVLLYLFATLPQAISMTHVGPLTVSSQNRLEVITKIYPHDTFVTYACNINDIENTQALTLLLYTHKKFSQSGRKILLRNKTCLFNDGKFVNSDTSDISSLSSSEIRNANLILITPNKITIDTMRWWLSERP